MDKSGPVVRWAANLSTRTTEGYQIARLTLFTKGTKMTSREQSGQPVHNVIIFGETGVGKSSLVNLIVGSNGAETSSDAVACTARNQGYEVTINNRKFRVWDTVGLDSGTFNWLPATFAERPLKRFLSKLFKKGEVDLLVYCVRASRATRALVRHYQTFYSTVCRAAVPVVVVITCLENSSGEMDNWWTKNAGNFRNCGMYFAGHACVTTLADEHCDSAMLQERRASSRRAVHDLISRTCVPYESHLASGNTSQTQQRNASGFLSSIMPWLRSGTTPQR
ncbi:P-loop containing nucleoside triphosphate hydrolase protein [Pisolithus orientalis]|uniref:P-loop containing nucleoside triphosphate hydrolase protein n=1 Tax=Pisolithus orientalis TaxID=936130 RepID=UPI002224081C|nr:P-loop containing nucleoside triphosphate hydrolase protein [Pisolithus orientalis]KAI6032804.1 P-loop containing nucleoside triphosphate hydrolase protein [Pisolithus orientalis]